MLAAGIQFLICAAVIIVAGTFLTRNADAIAELTKLGRLLIGSVLLAGSTSLPELTVDISAIRMNMPDLAVGDLLGSSLANLLILAMMDLSSHSRGRMLSRQAAAHALSGSLAATLTAIAGVGLLTGKAFAEFTILNMSPVTIALGIAYAFGVRLIFLDQRIAAQEARESLEQVPPQPTTTLGRALLGFAICAAVILVAGPFMASAAGVLADQSGLGKTFVGTTLVALSTSLPELVSSIAALRLGQLDLAIGNVFGSNAFNMVLLIPLDAFYDGPLFAVVSHEHVVTCMATILATLIAIMGQLYRVEARVRFIEPDAWLVMAVAFGALALLDYLPK